MAISEEEYQMLDHVKEMDFYAPLIALTLLRFNKLEVSPEMMPLKLAELVDEAYQDLEYRMEE